MWLQVLWCLLFTRAYCRKAVPYHEIFTESVEPMDDDLYENPFEDDAESLEDDEDSLRNPRFAQYYKGPMELLAQAVRIINSFGLKATKPSFGTTNIALEQATNIALEQPTNIALDQTSNLVLEQTMESQKFVERVVRPQEVSKQRLSGLEPCRKGAGVCVSSSECSSKGGTNLGRCSNCIGCNVCCKYQLPCQSQTDQFISYFSSPGYPKTQRRSLSCSLNVRIRTEVCQVRLDFLDFEMAAPVDCVCRMEDNMEIINAHRQVGVIGPGNNRICGINKNKHMYIDVVEDSMLILKTTTSGVQPVPLATDTTLSGDTAYRWNVRVTQIPCGVQEANNGRNVSIPSFYKTLRAPTGCLQYYRRGKGSFESFSFDGDSQLLTDTDYTVCMKSRKNTCGLTLRARTFSVPAAETDECTDGLLAAQDGRFCCERLEDPSQPPADQPVDRNYLAVSPAEAPNSFRELFCGQSLGQTNSVKSKTKGPLMVRVKTSSVCHDQDNRQPGVNPPDPRFARFTGFRIDYDINTGTC